ncbi:polyprenyl synthetase family protein [Rhodothermus marinus]|uniref:polyprenyl synthetase family protein n=1 Tax=Rhodothermus marinus TaxID=29549 RepID=UPI0012BA3B84|nr:polyprenyl synthetase [Rhodothermus marinus]BBM73219.1 polyprenyl synthetase [Rhodothermus marinus]
MAVRATPPDQPRVISLKDIQRPVAEELKHFQRYFRDAMRTSVPLLDHVARYLLRQKGKRIRPLLVLLTAKLCGGITEATYRAAALVELLHSATLVHDDVVDGAEQRRGMFSINAIWKNKVAVLFGDFLLSRGLLLALDHRDYDTLHALSDAVRRMSEGELLQIEKSRHLDIDEATYFRIISDKTASLIAACTKSGALSATDDPRVIDEMYLMGEKLGLAFQIRDDLFDYGEEAGKPIGNDLKEKKLTLPLIYALRMAPSSERRRILRIVRKKKKTRDDIQTVADFAEAYGGMAYARERMEALAGEARAILERYPPGDARDALLDLVDYTVTRNR